MTPYTDIIVIIAALSGAFVTVLLQQYFKRKNKQAKISIIEDRVVFSLTSSDRVAQSNFGNQGLGLYLNVDIECITGPVSFSEARFEIKRGKTNPYKLNCSVIKPKQFVSMHAGEIESVTFISNPSPYGDNPQDIIRKFVGGVYTLTIVSTRSPTDEILKIESKYVKEIVVPEVIDEYKIDIPKQKNKEEAERIRDVLKANGVSDVEISKESDVDLSNVTSLSQARV